MIELINPPSQTISKERTITTITLSVALAIGSSELFDQIERFSKEANENDYTSFTHYNYFYSYPKFGKTWKDGKDCQFHMVQTKCHLCDSMPKRNYAGVGTIYLLNNGICKDEILVNTGYKIVRGKKVWETQYIPNTPRLSPMILLCEDHVGSYFKWSQNQEVKKKYPVQLELF
jgi:hypothetical protein